MHLVSFSRALVTLLALASLLHPSAGVAAPCDDPRAVEKVRFIHDALVTERGRLNSWMWAWTGVNGVLAVGQGIAAPLVQDRGLRVDFIVGAVTNTVGVAFALLTPLGFPDAGELEAHTNEAAPCNVELAERLLDDGVAFESFNRGPYMHAGNVALNLGVFLLLGLGYGRWESGAINGGVGLGVGLAQLFTLPNNFYDAREKYRAGRLGGEKTAGIRFNVAPLFGRGTAGLGLTLML